MDTTTKATTLLGLNVGQEMSRPEATPVKAIVGAKGRRRSLNAGVIAKTHAPLIQFIREGFPVGAVQHILNSGRLSPVEVDRVVLPRKTLANRKRVGTLTAEQSDRLFRVARVIATAEEVFGNATKADAWLRRQTTALDGEQPLDLLDTEEGAREVETLLIRISHGIAA